MRAITQIPVNFPYQSYFDSALHEKAILTQPTNELIVPSTKGSGQSGGYAVAVAGFSDAPVAFKFYGGGDSGVVICKPGQVLKIGSFEAFDYGLPFGWLGGGHAVILVAHSKDSHLNPGPDRPELIFHRSRYLIQASPVDGTLPTVVPNWPLNFPWAFARRGAAVADQNGVPILRIEPTRAFARLRVALAAAAMPTFVFRGSRDFDETSTGTTNLTVTDNTAVEVRFDPLTVPAGAAVPFPSKVIPIEFAALACDNGGLTILDGADAVLTNAEIDIVRYGRL